MAPETSDPVINTTHQVPVRPTALDATGVERIVGPPVDDWRPAQVEPTEEQVRRMDEHNAREAARRETRLGALTDTERLDETAAPLVDANAAYDQELADARDAAPEGDPAPAETTPVETVETETVPPVEPTPETPTPVEERGF